MILGAMLAVQEVASPGSRKPLAEALIARIHRFYASFHSVFVAQGKISLINASLTGIYILVRYRCWAFTCPSARYRC